MKGASPEERPAVLERAKALSAEVKAAEAEQADADAALRAAHLAVPNVVLPGVPEGGEQDFVVLEQVGEVPTYDFPVRDHLDLGTALGAIDTERGAKVSGSRFAFLTGWGALIELALVNLAIGAAVEAGFNPVIAPALVRPEAMEGTGFLGAHADEVYRLAHDDLYLVGTSEVPLAAFHSGEVLDELPRALRRVLVLLPPRGRQPRQGHPRHHPRAPVRQGRDVLLRRPAPRPRPSTRGCSSYEKAFLSLLELPFRVIDVAAGDLGSSAARKYDCEAWLPSQERWLELTSTSNCTDFQARRLGIRVARRGRPVARRHAERHAVRRRPHHRGAARGAPACRRLGARPARRCGPTSPAARSCCRSERRT